MKIKLFQKLALFAASAVILLVPAAASAATASAGGNGLRVSPIRTSLTINPGSSQTVTIYVTNVTNTTAHLQAIVNDFQASPNESGYPDIILNPNESAPTHSLKQFVTTPPDFDLAPHEEKSVSVVITIPKGTAGGGYYGAVRFAAAGNGANNQVNVIASVGSLILVKVPGNINQNLQLASFGAAQNGHEGSFFTDGSNLSVITRFNNQGNIQEVPFGKILLKKGNTTIATYEVNGGSSPGYVLPNSIRKFTQSLKNLGWGKYTLEGNFGYDGNNGKLLSASQTFYIIPLWLIIAVVVIIILIILAIIFGRKEMKRHDRRLLANYRRKQSKRR